MGNKTMDEVYSSAASGYDSLGYWMEDKLEGMAALLYAVSCEDAPEYEGVGKLTPEAACHICSMGMQDILSRIREERREFDEGLQAIRDGQAA